ncbi:hypothetical protein RvY_18668 [Ramazzottius varieornatus]|uniref:Dynein regulatory complex subunit 4 n=1 Tax=Ramazzottius varieornatus TaxID=947166 RepID=A0A1D1W6M1_RAMVA|nr:hypothetical protein RvY_18668 [Ramazzottius varieornatus]
MPPKKDKKTKKKKEVKIDGIDIHTMSQEQLVRKIVAEVKQQQDARKQRSFEEQERDMIFRKLEIARAEMTKEEAEKFTTLRTIEQNRMIEQAELKVARQRARHLRYELEQECNKADVKTAAFAKEAREDHANILMEISHEHDETTAKNFDNRRAYEQQTKELMVDADKKYKAACDNYLTALTDRIEDLRRERDQVDEDADVDLRNYKILLDQKRLEQVGKLERNFEKNYHEVKQYFQELTYHNLTLIQDLTAQSKKLKGHLRDLYRRYIQITKETEKSKEPVRRQTQRLAVLKNHAEAFRKEKASFERLAMAFKVMKEERSKLMDEIAELDQQCAQVHEEHKYLWANFGPAVSEAKELIGCEASYMREKTASLIKQLEQMKAELRISALECPQGQAEESLRELELIENQCLNNIAMKKNLQFTLDKITKIYNDSLTTIRYIGEEHKLDIGEIDVTPLKTATIMARKPAEIGRVLATSS